MAHEREKLLSESVPPDGFPVWPSDPSSRSGSRSGGESERSGVGHRWQAGIGRMGAHFYGDPELGRNGSRGLSVGGWIGNGSGRNDGTCLMEYQRE